MAHHKGNPYTVEVWQTLRWYLGSLRSPDLVSWYPGQWYQAWALGGKNQQRGGEGLEQESREAQLLSYPGNREGGTPTPSPRSHTRSDHVTTPCASGVWRGQGTCQSSGTRRKPSDPRPSLPMTPRSDPPRVPAAPRL